MKDPNLEREIFENFAKSFLEMKGSQSDKDGWSYHDRGANLIIMVKPVENAIYKHEYRVRIIDRMKDSEDSE